jgi:AhpD family alkylhydroperoxidase
MSENYTEYRRNMLRRVGKLHKGQSDTMSAFSQLLKSTTGSEGVLSRKEKELIAVGISVAVHCEDCIVSHVYDALQTGASREEIGEAIGVGILMGGGPAAMYASKAYAVLDEFEKAGTAA